MNLLVREKRTQYSDDIVNDFTRELDKYTNNVDGVFCNYIYAEKMHRGENRYFVSFRFPGATRGHLVLDRKDVIVDIVIYKDSNYIYKDGVEEAIKKFIGYILEI